MNEQERLQCGRQIEQIFSQQIEQVSSYIDYLADIKKAISKNDSTKLIGLLENQQLNPEVIELPQKQQEKILTQYGYEISKDGLNNCIKDCHNSARLEELNEHLNDKLAELKNVLTVNALLVKKGQHRVKQSIRILSGHNLSNAVSSYSRQGSIDSPEESKHSLAQA